MASHGSSDFDGLEAYCSVDHEYQIGDRFGRLFPNAAPLFHNPKVLEALGARGGPMDEGAAPQTAPSVPVGMVFFGQFVDHDITLDVTSSFDTVNQANQIGNARTPTLDLDCVYGMGPEASPYLYVASGPFKGIKLLTGADVHGGPHKDEDLPRIGNTAVIGDFRNDENRIISQIQLAMIRFHNRMVDDLAPKYSGAALFEEAHRLTIWHYQWAVVHDFLAQVCGAGVVNRILSSGRKFYTPKVPFIPVEFSVAAYRFGHSMVPMEVQVQTGQPRRALFGSALGKAFSPVPGPDAVVDMHELFETFEGRQVQKAGRLDALLASTLLELPTEVDTARRSLATRNLIRGQSFLLPSGETVAAIMGRPEAEVGQITTAANAAEPRLNGGTPLWYYILKEAELIGREEADSSQVPGDGLGPVGATLVAEVIIGLIERDSRSWLATNRNWQPHSRPDNDEPLSTVGHILTYH